jgi:hypothetical protein
MSKSPTLADCYLHVIGKWILRVVPVGGGYGLASTYTNTGAKPLVEVYEVGERGSNFVCHYNIDRMMQGGRGLDLFLRMPDKIMSGEDVDKVREWICHISRYLKPSQDYFEIAPEWANYLAVDSDGNGYYFEQQPELIRDYDDDRDVFWSAPESKSHYAGWLCPDYCGELIERERKNGKNR